MNGGFTEEQKRELAAIVEQGVRRGFAEAGLRTDEADQIDDARKDFSFVRSLRKGVEGTASKVGMAVILAITSGLIYLMVQGFKLFGGK